MFFRQEIEHVLGVSKFQLNYLYNNVLGLENEMIESFFLFRQQLTMKAMKDLKSVDWNTMLSGSCIGNEYYFWTSIFSNEKKKNYI